jgi:hypothetical protein
MTTGLIDRLRERCSLPSTVSARDDDDPPVAVYLNPDGPEAAQALEKMREALTTAEQTFWRYGDLHRAKLGPHLTDEERRQIIEKVERNYGYAEEMAEALSLLEEK